MRVITAPAEPQGIWSNQRNLFLAGGITNCEDWQSTILTSLHQKDVDVVIFNPRRANFPMGDPLAAPEQIAWEHRWLTTCRYVSFWFPQETLCPITLFELGRYGFDPKNKKVFVGCHPNYARRQDVEIQLQLANPNVLIVYSIEALASQIAKEFTV